MNEREVRPLDEDFVSRVLLQSIEVLDFEMVKFLVEELPVQVSKPVLLPDPERQLTTTYLVVAIGAESRRFLLFSLFLPKVNLVRGHFW